MNEAESAKAIRLRRERSAALVRGDWRKVDDLDDQLETIAEQRADDRAAGKDF